MRPVAEALAEVRDRIAQASRRAGRPPGEVRLVGATKTVSPERLREALEAGLHEFGENRLQEAEPKMAALKDLPVVWHFLGGIQGRKAGPVAASFAWIHSVDRLSIAERLSRAATAAGVTRNVLVEVNLAGEESKSGCAPEEAAVLASSVARLPGLVLAGLMAVPPVPKDPEGSRPHFISLRRMRDDLRARLDIASLVHLSMGMTLDYEIAIEEGATLVRIGTALFGSRP